MDNLTIKLGAYIETVREGTLSEDIKMLEECLHELQLKEASTLADVETVLKQQGTGTRGQILAVKELRELTGMSAAAAVPVVKDMVESSTHPDDDEAMRIIRSEGFANSDAAIKRLVEIYGDDAESAYRFGVGALTGTICHVSGSPSAD